MNKEVAIRNIRGGWICGIITLVITVGFLAVALDQGAYETEGIYVDSYLMIDVVLIAIFTIGIFFKSRVFAVLMLAYFIISKLMQFSEGGSAITGLVAAVFLYFYFQAVRGTIHYHKIRADRKGDDSVKEIESIS